MTADDQSSTVPSNERRSDPARVPGSSDFLALVRQRERGKLKVYIGSAAGTGKTYRMLQEAHDLKRRGVDVVVGFVETAQARGDRRADPRSRGRAAQEDRVSRRDPGGDGCRRA